MYQNNQLDLLINAYEGSIPPNVAQVIATIQAIYKAYNDDYSRYTENYISMMESTFNSLKTAQLIPEAKGGTLRTTKPIDSENILALLSDYHDKLFGLRYLKFLSEEKKTVVFVGPNGCGKTTLLRNLINATGEDQIGYYPADRLLVINDSYNPERDFATFSKSYQNADKYASDIDNQSQTHYIVQQINQTITLFEKKRATEMDLYAKGKLRLEDSLTEKILGIWNELIKDRILFSEGALKVQTLGGTEYPIKYLSSGEKSIFYFLACIFLKEKKSYYFVDEPENNLNPSIVSKLWDIIEKHREGSIFVYLTHDSNFVASRINSKLFWIEKYDGTEWVYKPLPENDNLPQHLMVALVGNREPVLFCESQDEYKYDDIVFKMMFPEFKVIPAAGCDAVIAKVKAYSIAGLPQIAFGIIDCDYKDQSYLEGQETDGIFHLPFFEIENFLFSEEIITGVIATFSRDKENAFANLKSALKNDFISKKEQWIIRKIAFRLRETFFTGKIKRLKDFPELKVEYTSFSSSVDLDALHASYEAEIQQVIDADDYNTLLRYYDNKGIFTMFLPQLKLENKMPYKEAVFTYLSEHKDVLTGLRSKYFPGIIV
ncbi:AAA family ATPase [uncultured Bacteroides sp.]|uniref:ATP-dependent nuclease n=1 Tax=uncultured Bacteroides sp. TaxID=162156 RepID=UPI0025EF616B|nr:AAA family ATPase [uncultured Bacteroides sp.]